MKRYTARATPVNTELLGLPCGMAAVIVRRVRTGELLVRRWSQYDQSPVVGRGEVALMEVCAQEVEVERVVRDIITHAADERGALERVRAEYERRWPTGWGMTGQGRVVHHYTNGHAECRPRYTFDYVPEDWAPICDECEARLPGARRPPSTRVAPAIELDLDSPSSKSSG